MSQQTTFHQIRGVAWSGSGGDGVDAGEEFSGAVMSPVA
jgi:hypothetical protein